MLRKLWKDFLNRFLLISLSISVIVVLLVFVIERDYNKSIQNFFDTVWWFIVTITTTGYGDIVPSTPIGKVIAMFSMISGMLLMSVLSGNVASFIVKKKLEEEKGMGEAKSFTNHTVIINWNPSGFILLERIKNNIHSLVVVGELKETDVTNILNHLGPSVDFKYIFGNPLEEKTLERANIQKAKNIIILSNMELKDITEIDDTSVKIVLIVNNLNPKAKIIAEALDPRNEKLFLRAGADMIVSGVYFTPYLLSTSFTSLYSLYFFEELIKEFMTNPIPSEYVGKTFKELVDYFSSKGFWPIAILKQQKPPTIEEILSAEGEDTIDRFIKMKFQEAQMEQQTVGKDWSIYISPDDNYIIKKEDKEVFLIRKKII